MRLTLSQLAQRLGSSYRGDPNCVISGIATLEDAQPGQIAFLSNPLYRQYLKTTRASVVILAEEYAADCHTNAILSANPYLDYARVSHLFDPAPAPSGGIAQSAIISATATIHPSASIGANVVIEDEVCIDEEVVIGPGCVIGAGAKLGKKTRLWANVTIYHHTHIGDRVIVHSGVVIGSDGFGFAFEKNRWHKIAQIGRVVIGDDVEIGANTTIDRGAIGDTLIEEGVKLDNQIQIGHNVQIGAHTAIAGCTGISGSTKIGRYCRIGGGSGIAGHLQIVDRVIITGMSMITSSILQVGTYSSGTGLQENRAWQKNVVRFRHLDDVARHIKRLEKRVQELENLSQSRNTNE